MEIGYGLHSTPPPLGGVLGLPGVQTGRPPHPDDSRAEAESPYRIHRPEDRPALTTLHSVLRKQNPIQIKISKEKQTNPNRIFPLFTHCLQCEEMAGTRYVTSKFYLNEIPNFTGESCVSLFRYHPAADSRQ